MNKDRIKNIVIVALLLITIGLVGCFGVNDKKEEVGERIIYQGYHDDLIKIGSQINANVVANLIEDNHYLAVYIGSKEERSIKLDVTLKIIEETGNLFYTGKGYTYQLTQGAKVAFVIPLPELNHEKLKEMVLDIKKSSEDTESQDLSQFTFNVQTEEDDYHNIISSASINYGGNQPLSILSGTMIAWKNNKIIDLIGFEMEHVNSGETMVPFDLVLQSVLEKTSETVLEEKARQYDKIEAFVNYYEEEK